MFEASHRRWIVFGTGLCLAFAVVLIFGISLIAWAPRAGAGEHPSFKTDIVPILNKNCVECHQPGGEGYGKSGLDLTTYQGLMKGTRHGPIIAPGDAFTSNLNVLIEGRASTDIAMPFHKKKIDKWRRMLIRRWVNNGAKNN